MPDERWWYWFVYASLGTYFSALLLALANYAVKGEKNCKHNITCYFTSECKMWKHFNLFLAISREVLVTGEVLV